MKKAKSPIRNRESVKFHYLPVEDRINSFKEVNLGYNDLAEVVKECERCYQCFNERDPNTKPPPCMQYCPTHCNSREIIKNVLLGNITEALRIIYEHYPFPRSVERVCPGFCQLHCTAGIKGDPIQIPILKRYIVDYYGLPEDFFECEPETGKKMAVIGSGPLGLTAAYFLRKYGHQVTIFEKSSVLGGLLTIEIPEFRLPKAVLNEEIDNIKKLGVDFEVEHGYDMKFNHEKLFETGFDAILIGIGAHKAKWMNIPGEKSEHIFHSTEFLKAFNLKLGLPDLRKKKTVVIGGGSSATDAARIAKRLEADVSIVYRRQKEQMPAGKIEIRDTEDEGIPIIFLTNPTEFVCREEELKGAKCHKMELGELDPSGRPLPIPLQDTDFTIEANYVIEAIGQVPDVSGFDLNKYEITEQNTFVVDNNFKTSVPGVYAGGDCVTGSRSVVEAVAQGKVIAEKIHRILSD